MALLTGFVRHMQQAESCSYSAVFLGVALNEGQVVNSWLLKEAGSVWLAFRYVNC